MSGFEPRIFGVGSDRSANCDTTTARPVPTWSHSYNRVRAMLSVYCFIILDFQSSDSYQLSGFMDPIQLPWECLCDAAEFKRTNIKIWKEKKIGVIS